MLVNTQQQAIEIFLRKEGGMWLYRRFGPGQDVTLGSLDIHFSVAAVYERVRVPIVDDI
jgi:hypothetical protein